MPSAWKSSECMSLPLYIISSYDAVFHLLYWIGLQIPENGFVAASTTKITEVQKKVVTEKTVPEVDYNDHRVFLLGENRWEEPSRLSEKVNKSTGNKKYIASKCIVCRGERRVLCMGMFSVFTMLFQNHNTLHMYIR